MTALTASRRRIPTAAVIAAATLPVRPITASQGATGPPLPRWRVGTVAFGRRREVKIGLIKALAVVVFLGKHWYRT